MQTWVSTRTHENSSGGSWPTTCCCWAALLSTAAHGCAAVPWPGSPRPRGRPRGYGGYGGYGAPKSSAVWWLWWLVTVTVPCYAMLCHAMLRWRLDLWWIQGLKQIESFDSDQRLLILNSEAFQSPSSQGLALKHWRQWVLCPSTRRAWQLFVSSSQLWIFSSIIIYHLAPSNVQWITPPIGSNELNTADRKLPKNIYKGNEVRYFPLDTLKMAFLLDPLSLENK